MSFAFLGFFEKIAECHLKPRYQPVYRSTLPTIKAPLAQELYEAAAEDAKEKGYGQGRQKQTHTASCAAHPGQGGYGTSLNGGSKPLKFYKIYTNSRVVTVNWHRPSQPLYQKPSYVYPQTALQQHPHVRRGARLQAQPEAAGACGHRHGHERRGG